jgi:rhodanese-related sulfurtransferase
MTTVEIVLLGAALALALWGAVRITALKSEIQRATYATESLQSSLRGLREEVERALQVTRGHLARVSAGEHPDPEMIRDGLPFAVISVDEAQELVEEIESMLVLDVRSAGEYARGHIRGAKLLPVDELERRMRELPQDKSTPMIVHCQSGGRSVAACEMLAGAGYSTLYHMAGGMGAWKGPVEQGSPLAARATGPASSGGTEAGTSA